MQRNFSSEAGQLGLFCFERLKPCFLSEGHDPIHITKFGGCEEFGNSTKFLEHQQPPKN